jgi:hypothetical protein
MPESGLSGSVRGVPSNGHPYRDPGPGADLGLINLKRRSARREQATQRNSPAGAGL